ncbi:polysaccharide pyruvyl transferase CsaB [Lusitaniella coriacea LEGE 07157]|uniref:Polysaccharide pyruvyl transferase CsaB n=1 Tax=Lusitaniella coriacea LEGE 07157 TaxID=945747 RepID=A0A8J7E0D5_9CYAN|nr:polysaccharide pyruvyl transferase CsaB [Lusitaniella coriacea]MBE9118778.1 polysaccharide pyruvyl transferase CsaB [Lusitaniella coriacea LEGE 07157]
MGQIRVVLCGYYGKGNGGDEALLASLLQMLPDRVTPIVLSGNPQETRDRYGVESCDRASGFSVLKALRSADVFIWGGGSLLQDSTSFASPFYYAGLMALAQQQGLTTIAWAQGIGPLKYPLTREIAKRAIQGCTAISVRDRASAQLVQNWQRDPLLAPDPVWALEAHPTPPFPNSATPPIAVNLRAHPQLTPQRLNCLTQALIRLQTATNAPILLVPFQPAQDLPLCQTLATQLPGTHQIVSLSDPRQLKGLFQNVRLIVGMRLHSLIMAASQSCRCVALSYDPKVTHLMGELNLPGWELEQLPNDPQLISQKWQDEYDRGMPLNPKQIQSFADRARLHRQVLQEVLERIDRTN